MGQDHIWDILKQYFPQASNWNWGQLEQFTEEIKEWNEKINVVSRKDIDHLVERHLVPSLGIAKVLSFKPGTTLLDVGTGGGFPGLPLAICFPECQFTLIDSIGKKIKVVQSVADTLGLKNVRAIHGRAEDVNEKFDFIIGRAVTALPRFVGWIRGKFKKKNQNDLPNGLLYLKGGDISEEVKALGIPPTQIFDLEALFNGSYCEGKHVLYFEGQVLRR